MPLHSRHCEVAASCPVRVRARPREGARISEERATNVSASAGAFDRLSDARLEDVLDILAYVDGRPQSAAPLAEKKEIVGMQLGVTCGARCARKSWSSKVNVIIDRHGGFLPCERFL